MALSARLQMRQAQALVMTPQLLQSIKLLQFSHAELEAFIAEEMERNPLLEPDERQDDGAYEPAEIDEGRSGKADEGDWLDVAGVNTAESAARQCDTSPDNLFPDEPGPAEPLPPDMQVQWKSAASHAQAPNGAGGIEDFAAQPVTLRQHVNEQIAFTFDKVPDRLIAAELADDLDEAGYFRGQTDIVAERLNVDETVIETVLAKCQGFDPPGLFARNLAECLVLQLRARDRFDPAMQVLVANLELLARRDFIQLERLCGVDSEDLLDMACELKALDPRPGAVFTSAVADPVQPDIIVRTGRNGGWEVELNPETLPRVLVNQEYYARIAPRIAKDEERGFLAQCLQNANWLTRSLDQRARTILKVASEIVRLQDGFLIDGVRHLKPLNLKTVADAIGVHESTVSRATANKYMMTPRGLFELRYFFTPAIAATATGEAHSSAAVRERIRDLIAKEDADGTLSDDALVALLNKSGVDIARRTVAKYREAMNIPSSVQRRREKRAYASLAARPPEPAARISR